MLSDRKRVETGLAPSAIETSQKTDSLHAGQAPPPHVSVLPVNVATLRAQFRDQFSHRDTSR